MLSDQARTVLRHPGAFALRTLKAFRANQGLLLAGAVAYYALLSVVPLLILAVIALSHVIDRADLLLTLGRYLRWLVPGHSDAIVDELSNFLEHRDFIGWVLFATLLFFSSLAFTVLENAMSVIFVHRVVIRRRHFLVSAVLPYFYILFLGIGILLVTLVAGSFQALGEESIEFLGYSWSLGGVSGALLYLLGVAGEIFVLASIYMVMPVGRPSLRHALIGAVPRCCGKLRAMRRCGTAPACRGSERFMDRLPLRSWFFSPWKSARPCFCSAHKSSRSTSASESPTRRRVPCAPGSASRA